DLGEGVGGLAKGLPKSLPLIRRFAAPSPRLRGEGTTAGLRDFEGGGGVAAGGGQPAVAAQLGEAQGLEALAVEGGGAGMELVVVASVLSSRVKVSRKATPPQSSASPGRPLSSSRAGR